MTDDDLVQWITALQNESSLLREAIREYVDAGRNLEQDVDIEAARDRMSEASLVLAELLDK